jgi:uncharacterized protein (TIGR02145 family)
MKKITLLFLLIFAIAETHAQNYLISFAGTGASATVESVQVENLTQCIDITLSGSDTLHLTGTVGINELNTVADNIVHIYPNPTTGTCSIDFDATAQGKTTIGLYDISGKKIIQVQELLSKGHYTYSLTGISSGIYTLKIESDKYSYTAKIVSSNAIYGTTEIKHIETTPGTDKQIAASNTGQMKNFKSVKSVIDMQYTTGDILKLTGKSGVYSTVFMIVPTQTQTVTFNFVACADADNNHYPVVQIGTQIWMAENLKATKYLNGNPIPNITGATQWQNLTTGACSYYNNDSITNAPLYGALYNWYAVSDARNICPAGWHVPSDAEWNILEKHLDSTVDTTASGWTGTDIGGKLKETCKTLWNSPNTGATNSSGFSALPCGYRYGSGAYNYIRNRGSWRLTTAYDASHAWRRYLDYNSSQVSRGNSSKNDGFSVRCVMD